jgi:phosphatidylserine decarboxylase
MLKALGLSGTPVKGSLLVGRLEMEEAEVVDTINGLVTLGYIIPSKVNIQKMQDVEQSYFHVNATLARELHDAMRPGRRKEEERPRRRRSG